MIDPWTKHNPLIHFAYANFEESRGKVDKCRQIYDKLTNISDLDPTLTFIQYMRFARRAEGLKTARQVFRMAREDGRIKLGCPLWSHFFGRKVYLGDRTFIFVKLNFKFTNRFFSRSA